MLNILIVGNFHHKNIKALQKYKNVKIHTDWNDIHKCDVVMSPQTYIPIEHSDKVYIFGPHFSVFPDNKFITYLENWKPNATYNALSEWVALSWLHCVNQDISHKLTTLPFGVDTETFNEVMPIQNRKKVLLYFKHRSPDELAFLENFLTVRGISHTIFSYDRGYNENDFLSYLQSCQYAIVLAGHESQGFGIEETLSCNVPLLVWNVKSMNQEYGMNYPDIPATTIPYWDERCGEVFNDREELENKFSLFISKLHTYKPREYVVENLSLEKCEEKLMNLVSNIKSTCQ